MRTEILTKEQFRDLLGHMKGRRGLGIKSAALLSYSSGMVIDHVLRLKIGDLHLDEDPPYADIKYVMRRYAHRAYFSHEARDSIEAWLKEKYGEEVADAKDLLFDYTKRSWYYHWNKANEKANLTVVSYALRENCFVSMARAGVPDAICHMLLGHELDPDLHDTISNEDVAKVYKEHMNAVSIYEAEETE